MNMSWYAETKARVEQLIAEATAKGLLESDMDNDYTWDFLIVSADGSIWRQMSGRRRISMSFAKRLHSKLDINADLILEYA